MSKQRPSRTLLLKVLDPLADLRGRLSTMFARPMAVVEMVNGLCVHVQRHLASYASFSNSASPSPIYDEAWVCLNVLCLSVPLSLSPPSGSCTWRGPHFRVFTYDLSHGFSRAKNRHFDVLSKECQEHRERLRLVIQGLADQVICSNQDMIFFCSTPKFSTTSSVYLFLTCMFDIWFGLSLWRKCFLIGGTKRRISRHARAPTAAACRYVCLLPPSKLTHDPYPRRTSLPNPTQPRK